MANTVLVTGGSGYLAGHVIRRLLDDGYAVRTTLRSLDREPEVRTRIDRDPGELSFAAADLTSDNGWATAMAGCDYVLHVASPFPPQQPKNEDELIAPAREGTLRVLRAAATAGVRRVVVTSSFAAIGYSPKPPGVPYDESDWTDATGRQSPYVKSKTFAERAAWDFAAQHRDGPELTVVNPVGIFGPVLGPDYATSGSYLRSKRWPGSWESRNASPLRRPPMCLAGSPVRLPTPWSTPQRACWSCVRSAGSRPARATAFVQQSSACRVQTRSLAVAIPR
jgi:nucleoside-diphosphate-sugar epimerase